MHAEDGEVLQISLSWTELTGFTLKDASSIQTWLTRAYGADGDDVSEAVRRAFGSGETIRGVEFDLVTRNGQRRVWSFSASSPGTLRDGRRFIVGMAEDITARKEAAEAKAALAAIVTDSDDAIISKTLDGTIRSWNAGAQRLFGYNAAEAIGQSITLIVPPDRWDEEQSLLERLRRGERIEHFETVRISNEKRRLDISLTISPIRDGAGRLIGASKVARDISARKHAEQTTRFLADASAALAELSDYKSTLQRVAALAVPVFADWCAVELQEPDGTAHRLAIIHGEPAKVQHLNEMQRLYPPRVTDVLGHVAVLRTGRPQWAAKITDTLLAGVAHDDRHLQMLRNLDLHSCICVPLESHGKVFGALTFVTAESGRAYDANDLHVAMDLAKRTVIAIENADLLEALKEADHRKDEFLAMLAHELRNPLAPLRNMLEIMKRSGVNSDLMEQARNTMERQLGNLVRLVDDLIDVSRITRNKIELRKERIELASVIHHALETCLPLVEGFKHEVTVMLPPEPIHVFADPVRLSQVFSNLLNNACKYTEPKGHVWVAAERQGDDVIVRVRDSGLGIPSEQLSRVFDLFTQVDQTLERSQGGLGIGLTIVKRLVEMHDGTVAVHSEGRGRGSEFLVRLPVLTQQSKLTISQPPRETALLASRRILIVDDNLDSAESLTILLKLIGNETELAQDGQEAIEVAKRFRPDVVLLDIGLPRMNGYDVCHRMRQEPWGQTILIVALTGWGTEEDRRKSEEAGFDAHMVKPVDPEALIQLLSSRKTSSQGQR